MIARPSPRRLVRIRHPASTGGWVRSLTPLVLCALLVLSSPAGQAVALGLHVTLADHHGAPQPLALRTSAGEPRAPAVESAPTAPIVHAHGGHEHSHEPPHAPSHRAALAHGEPAPTPPPITSVTPHEHNGTVHTHEPSRSDDSLARAGSLWEFYLVPLVGSPRTAAPGVALFPGSLRRLVEVVRTVDPPPPRG